MLSPRAQSEMWDKNVLYNSWNARAAVRLAFILPLEGRRGKLFVWSGG